METQMEREDIKNDDQIVEEAADGLAAPESQEGQDDDWSPDHLPAAQRAAYDKAVAAVDSFIESHPEYKQTDENQQAILDYLERHDLAISPASLELCWEKFTMI